MKKEEKLLKMSPEDKEDLAKIAGAREYRSLARLFRIEENNIIILSFKANSTDPELRTKKAWYEGRAYELRKILKSFEEAKKEE